MGRYTPECVDGRLFLVGEGHRVEVGTLDDVVAAVGGETYTVEYADHHRTQPWVQTDDGTLDVDVREAVTTLPHTEETVSELAATGMDTERYGLPTRTVVFADRVVDILERQYDD